MHPHASSTLITCFVALSTLGQGFKCAPTVPNEQCLSSAHAFSAGLLFPNKTSVVVTPQVTPAQLYALAPQYTCAPTVKASDCLAGASSFSAWLRNKTASVYLTTTNLTITAAIPLRTPCTLTKPYGTDVIILDACPTRLPPPHHRPEPPPPAGGYTRPGDIDFLLPTPTSERIRQLATPTGTWKTCVLNNIMSCTNALCTSDSFYAPRCTDRSLPKSEGRELCINGLAARCEGFHCEILEEAGRRENMREGKGGGEWDVHVPVDDGVCKGWEGSRAVRAPARKGAPLPTKTCIGRGLGKAANPNDRVWQNGECYPLRKR